VHRAVLRDRQYNGLRDDKTRGRQATRDFHAHAQNPEGSVITSSFTTSQDNLTMRMVPALIATLTLPSMVFAADAAKDKSGYTLFNPTPKEQMRDLSTDRPDTTESPYSVDAGHYQVEWETLSVGRDKSGGVTTKTISSSVNAKVGLTNRSDLQVVLEIYRGVDESGNGADFDESGIGDLDIRYKFNFWGNDGGPTAAGVMPFITLPTHSDRLDSNRDVEGGLILPFATEIEGGWDLGVMLEMDVVRNAADDGYTVSWLQSITASHDIAGDLGGFLEFVNIASADDNASSEAYFDAGLTYGFGSDIQFDAGTNIGLTQASEDLRFFIGISVRK
jgi:Putative MetA-pathway of phenol degradation